MTIEKYLQNKVDINEITESDRDFILNQLDVISHKQDFNTCELRGAVIVYFLLDYRQSEMFLEKTESDLEKELSEISLFNKQHLAEVLNELVDMKILLNVSNKYCLSYAYIMTLEMNNKNIKDSNCEYECNNGYDCKNCQSEEDIKKTAIIRAENIFTIYNNYHGEAINQIEESLKSVFGFEITNNDNLLNFEMGGAKAGSEPCGYNLYLSRGYIVFEAEDNSTIDNVYTLDDFSELVDLIKDLNEDV